MEKKLYKSQSDRKVCGVCGGFAKYLDIDATIVRLGIIFLTLFTVGCITIPAYIVCAMVIPDEPTIG